MRNIRFTVHEHGSQIKSQRGNTILSLQAWGEGFFIIFLLFLYEINHRLFLFRPAQIHGVEFIHKHELITQI